MPLHSNDRLNNSNSRQIKLFLEIGGTSKERAVSKIRWRVKFMMISQVFLLESDNYGDRDRDRDTGRQPNIAVFVYPTDWLELSETF